MERMLQGFLQMNSQYLKWILLADKSLSPEQKEAIEIAVAFKEKENISNMMDLKNRKLLAQINEAI